MRIGVPVRRALGAPGPGQSRRLTLERGQDKAAYRDCGGCLWSREQALVFDFRATVLSVILAILTSIYLYWKSRPA
jgi:hypothetical protein